MIRVTYLQVVQGEKKRHTHSVNTHSKANGIVLFVSFFQLFCILKLLLYLKLFPKLKTFALIMLKPQISYN